MLEVAAAVLGFVFREQLVCVGVCVCVCGKGGGGGVHARYFNTNATRIG